MLGDLYHVDVRYHTRGFGDVHGPMRWQYDRARAGSGALANLGSHVVHLLDWWFGGVSRVSAAAHTVIPERDTVDGGRAAVTVDDVCAAVGELANGASMTMTVGWVTHIERVGLDVALHGSVASAWLHDASGDGYPAFGRVWLCDDSMPVPRPRDLCVDPAEDWSDVSQACVRRMVREFMRSRREGTDAGPAFVDGLRVQYVLDAIQRSAREERWIDVEYGGPAGSDRLVHRTG